VDAKPSLRVDLSQQESDWRRIREVFIPPHFALSFDHHIAKHLTRIMPLAMVSTNRHFQLHNSLLETERQGLVIVDFPDSLREIPFAACFFNATLQFGLLKINSQSDDDRALRHGSTGFFNYDFDRGATFAPLFVIAIANADRMLPLRMIGYRLSLRRGAV
jgi:hypothetical protein